MTDHRLEGTTSVTEDREGQPVMPFYVVCDVSGSMTPDIRALNTHLQNLVVAVRAQLEVNDIAQMGVIAFSDSARVVVPLAPADTIDLPPLQIEGGTSYGSAFRLLATTIEHDLKQLRAANYDCFRPLVFFLTDGEPLDHDWLETFRSTLTYDVASRTGMVRHPIMVPFGIRDAGATTISQLAYPPERGRWYLSSSTDVETALKAMMGIIKTSVMVSSTAAAQKAAGVLPAGRAVAALPAAPAGVRSGASTYDPDRV